jgi:hypothetical protein
MLINADFVVEPKELRAKLKLYVEMIPKAEFTLNFVDLLMQAELQSRLNSIVS